VMGETFTTVRAPYSFDGEPETGVTAPPILDAHGDEIRHELAARKLRLAAVQRSDAHE
jgi:crotonobetainyl-CoA:carnitine CoA-transferase CaiB-like acyl-CoA transferase